jgi:oligopeptide transport system substrate-binding protein
VLAGGEPRTLDPARTLGSAGDYIGLIFSGLVAFDTNLQVVPDLAERWEISPDGLIYTFHLRHDVTFHNGKPFSAADVKYSLERAADPATESNTAQTYLGDIVGVQAKLDGEAQDVAGVTVIDDYTVALTIDAPKAYFLAKLTSPYLVDRRPRQRRVRQRLGRAAQRHRPVRARHLGPQPVMIFDRNPSYYRAKAGLAHVLFLLYQGVPLQMYEVGDIDITGVGGDSLARARDPQDPLSAICERAGVLHQPRGVRRRAKPFDDPQGAWPSSARSTARNCARPSTARTTSRSPTASCRPACPATAMTWTYPRSTPPPPNNCWPNRATAAQATCPRSSTPTAAWANPTA